jgi:large subunit ribosomal protein LP2
MKHLAAYLLLDMSGKKPAAKDIKKLLQSVGIEADNDKLNLLFTELEGKDINEVGVSVETFILVFLTLMGGVY